MATESKQSRTAASSSGASNFESSARSTRDIPTKGTSTPSATTASNLNLSPSVRVARDRFPVDEPIAAVAFVDAILDQSDHRTKYADGKASDLTLVDPPGAPNEQLPAHWLEQVRTLYDEERVPKLHGRLVIFGLSLLDLSLRVQLQQNGFLAALEQELSATVDELLTDKGRSLRHPPDSVPTRSDNPLQTLEEDQLGRAVFARYLAKRIPEMSAQDQDGGSFSIHLYGAWGAGKSTVLNFLRAELQTTPDQAGTSPQTQDERWLVVEFNAWRHQHIQPPWWALMDSVFRQTKSDLGWWQRIQEYGWRFSTGRMHYLIGITVLAWMVLGVVWFTPATESLPDTMAFWATVAEGIGGILAVLITIWTIVKGMNHAFLPGTVKETRNYVDSTQDPMNKIKARFNSLIRHLSERSPPRRVAIFIDDLDRCQSDYVVELLEGIQTLFREAPVVFVVAADQRWLNACFEEVYNKLKPMVNQPGKSLGTLFLEKAFQFSTPLPGIPEELKNEYWQDLIQIKVGDAYDARAAARDHAEEVMAGTKSEGDIMERVSHSQDKSFLERHAIHEVAVLKLAQPSVLQRTEHILKPLVRLLEPNPRAMKRLVNTYSMNRALAFLAHVDIERDHLALWTILTMRWPQLAAYLENHPDMMEKVGQEGIDHADDQMDEHVRALFNDEQVTKFIETNPTPARLERETVRKCALIRG